MDYLSVTEIIEEVLSGKTQAFCKIVETYDTMVYAVAFRFLHDSEEAKDVSQETFLKAFQHLSDYDKKVKFSTWLYVIVSRLCLDTLKSARYRRKQKLSAWHKEPVSEETPLHAMVHQDLEQQLEFWIGSLSNKQKWVFILCDLQQLPMQEVKEITGMTESKISSNLYLARRAIKQKYKQYYQ